MAQLIVFLVIVGFSVIQSLIKAANERAKAEQKRQARAAERQGGDRPQGVQNEIEAFLQGVNNSGGGDGQSSVTATADETRARERREKRKREIEAKRAAAERRQQEQQRLDKERRKQQQQRSKRKSRGPVGGKISQHVDQYINRHVEEYIDDDVEEYVEDTIVESVQSNLGRRDLEMPATTSVPDTNTAADAITKLLRNPEGVRNAILVNEILAKPRALRK